MTEEFSNLYQQSVRSQLEIQRLNALLQDREAAHREALLQCYLGIIGELDQINAAARAQLTTLHSGSEAYRAAAATLDQLRQPLLSVLHQQGVQRIPAPYNLQPDWSVFESPDGEVRPADRSDLIVEKDGYSKGDWLIRAAVLGSKQVY